MTKALISGKVLTWARERAGLSRGSLTDVLNLSSEQLRAWEAGVKYPTFRQAENIAQKLSIPLGFLFLENPPELTPQIPDLRTVGTDERNHFSPEFEAVLNDSLVKQDWYKEQVLSSGGGPLRFVGKFSLSDDNSHVAASIRESIGLDASLRRSCKDGESFLNKLIERIEHEGVLVMRNGVVRNNNRRKLQVDEFRGFVLSDPVVPLIFINNNDSVAAKVFTLIHELVHVWIGESGVTNLAIKRPGGPQVKKVERFCNAVAAEVLVPESEFLNLWDRDISLMENLHALSRIFHVSRLVILIKARSLEEIDEDKFTEIYPQLIGFTVKKGTGGNSLNTIPVRNSKKFTRALLASTLEGNTLYLEAARLLGLRKLDTITSLAAHMEIR